MHDFSLSSSEVRKVGTIKRRTALRRVEVRNCAYRKGRVGINKSRVAGLRPAGFNPSEKHAFRVEINKSRVAGLKHAALDRDRTVARQLSVSINPALRD